MRSHQSPSSRSAQPRARWVPRVSLCAVLAATLGLAGPVQADVQSLTTTFASNNGLDGNMFDVTAANDIRVVSVDCNAYAGSVTIEVYTVPGGYGGHETNAGAWTLRGSGTTTSAGTDQPTPIPFALDIEIAAGETLGFYVTSTGSGMRYTDGTGSSPAASNDDLAIYEGRGVDYPFGTSYSPRTWNGTIYYEADSGTPYCFADLTGGVCPCGNFSFTESGCMHSGGVGAVLSSSGSTSVASDQLRCRAEDLTIAKPALLFTGTMAVNGGNGQPLGDGLLCAGGTIQRLWVETSDGAGYAEWGTGMVLAGGFGAGETRFFQVWYRDPGTSSPCSSGFNLSNALEVQLSP